MNDWFKVTMDGKQIREITPEGVVYLDENGEEKFIDFAVCNENYIKFRTTTEYWEWHKQMNRKSDADWEEYLEWIKSHKQVGVRDIPELSEEGTPYIKFYTEPLIRFTFKFRKDYEEVVYVIRKAGWRIFNLT